MAQKKGSVKQKVMGSFLGVVLVVLFFALALAFVKVRSYGLAMADKKVTTLNSSLTALSAGALQAKDFDSLNAALKNIVSKDRDILFITVLSHDNKVLASTQEASAMQAGRKKKLLTSVNVLPSVSAQKPGLLKIGYTVDFIANDLSGIFLVSLLIAIAFLIAGALAFQFSIQRSIVAPLSSLLMRAKQVAEGDLSEEAIAITTRDEIGELAAAFQQMVRSLRTMVTHVHETAEKVAHSLQEVSTTFQEMNVSSQDVANAIGQVSKGAAIQAEQLTGAFEIMEKAAISLKQVVANAQSANSAVTQTSGRAETGRVTANEAVNRIGRLTNTVLETTAVIQSLGKMSQQISEITATITSIADQTNLLALNAAIEAARAGEAGRGFAVVAEEVRKLAEAAAEAVAKIGGLIKSIQGEAERAVKAIEVSSKEVQGGKEQVAKIAEALGDINRVAREAATFVDQITVSGQERVLEVEKIVRAINEVASVAKESATSIEQVSSTSQEQTASMQEITASAQELAQLAMDLKDMVGKFRL